MLKLVTIIVALTLSSPVLALQLKELYTMGSNDRAWYLGGIYDANIVQWNDKGKRSDCIEELGFKGFNNLLSKFIVSLPEDLNSKERKTYDQMNVATLSWLLLDKECVK